MTTEPSSNLLLDLPLGVLRLVLNAVDACDVVSVICTCRQMRKYGSEDIIWEPRFSTWQYASEQWQTEERPWIAKYRARKEVILLSTGSPPCYCLSTINAVQICNAKGDNAVPAGPKDLGKHKLVLHG